MPTIDLGPPRPTPHDLLDGLPRRVALTLPELRFAAARANGAPLPFDLRAGDEDEGGLDDRLGRSRGSAEQAAYAEALDRLHDPATSLSRRGLLVGGPDDGVVDEGLLGAIGLLATPTVAVDLDVAAGPVQVKSWHRQTVARSPRCPPRTGWSSSWPGSRPGPGRPSWPGPPSCPRTCRCTTRSSPTASTSRTTWPTPPSRPPGPTAPTSSRVLVAHHPGAVTDGDGRELTDGRGAPAR